MGGTAAGSTPGSSDFDNKDNTFFPETQAPSIREDKHRSPGGHARGTEAEIGTLPYVPSAQREEK